MANSGTVTAGSAALASQYNNLRDDVLNTSTGHTHTGASENGAKVAATGVSSGTAANGAVLTADGSGAAAFLAAGASGGILKYEQFTSSGSFVIPANASSSAVIVLDVVGAGAGGGGGNNRGAGTGVTTRCSGAGGAHGTFFYLVSQFGTASGTVSVTIGAGGAGGTGTSSTGGTGGAGAAGGLTSFGTASFFGASAEYDETTPAAFNSFVPGSWFRGVTPNVTQNVATGTAAFSTFVSNVFYALGGFGSSGNTNEFRSGSDNGDGGAAGATGGGIFGGGTVGFQGGVGGKAYLGAGARRHIATVSGGTPQYSFGGGSGSAGTAGGGAGGAGTPGTGDGGGGGGASTTGNGGAGGAGSTPGGGGGSGGGCRTGSTSGAGGAGGSGRVRVWVIG